MYDELIKRLREICPEEYGDEWEFAFDCLQAMHEAADAIEAQDSQLDDFKRLCLPLKENRLYKFADGSFTEVTLMIVPREPTEPQKEERA